jgi:hypothetical protein
MKEYNLHVIYVHKIKRSTNYLVVLQNFSETITKKYNGEVGMIAVFLLFGLCANTKPHDSSYRAAQWNGWKQGTKAADVNLIGLGSQFRLNTTVTRLRLIFRWNQSYFIAIALRSKRPCFAKHYGEISKLAEPGFILALRLYSKRTFLCLAFCSTQQKQVKVYHG